MMVVRGYDNSMCKNLLNLLEREMRSGLKRWGVRWWRSWACKQHWRCSARYCVF